MPSLPRRKPKAAKPDPRRGKALSLTAALSAAIIRDIRAGQPPMVAARGNGVPHATFHEWLQRGRGEHPKRPPTAALIAFADAVDGADAFAEGRAWARTHDLEPRFWLKLRGKAADVVKVESTSTVEVSGPGGEPIEHTVHGTATPEDVRSVLEILIETGALDHLITVEAPEGGTG